MARLFLFACALLAGAATQAQHNKVAFTKPPDITLATPSGQMTVPCAGVSRAGQGTDSWSINVHKLNPGHDVPDPEALAELKAAKLQAKLQMDVAMQHHDEAGPRTVTPALGTNFLGNEMHSGSPPDNTLAVSNGGLLVGVDNATIEYYDVNGNYLLIREEHADFFNDPTLTASMFDPRVLYDSQADRFIFVLLHGSSSGTSKVLISFSKTNDPQDGWWTYQFPGNPNNDGSWFDYPNIAVSNNELYVTGNLFYNGGSFNQAVIYQIDKNDGYAGQSVTWQYWNVTTGFTLVPLQWGQQGNYGPGVLLVSSESTGDNAVTVWDLTDDMTGSPALNAYTYSTNAYSPPGYALQQGSSDYLDTGDSRVEDGFYLDGIIHFVLNDDYSSGYGGLFYCRINIGTGNVQDEKFGLSGYDYCYPSVASFTTSATDRSVMISFVRSSSSIYPETRVVNCDNNFDWSTSTQVKAGETYVDVLGSVERWGDYSRICRKHNEAQPTNWMIGCFGHSNYFENNTYSGWVAEINGSGGGAAPVANFTASPVSGMAPLVVQFNDQSTNSPNAWTWSLAGGLPSSSSVQNPTATYAVPGTYSVSLVASNGFGNDTETKNNYITVTAPIGINGVTETPAKIFPNPARDMFRLEFQLGDYGPLRIVLADEAGRTVKILYEENSGAGTYALTFNRLALDVGTYFVIGEQNSKQVIHEKLVVAD